MFGVLLLNVWCLFAECMVCKSPLMPIDKGFALPLKVIYKGDLKFNIKGKLVYRYKKVIDNLKKSKEIINFSTNQQINFLVSKI